MKTSLRQALADDFEFLRALHEAAMRPYIEMAYGPWDAAAELARFRKHFQPSALQVIVVDGVDAGMLQVEDRAEEIFINNLWLLPAYQKRGIGTRLLREIIERAARLGKPVALGVLKGNVGARSLYQRLGFGVTGEDDTHYSMAYYPK